MTIVWTVFVPYVVFGFYQEVLYRGMLQTELGRSSNLWIVAVMHALGNSYIAGSFGATR